MIKEIKYGRIKLVFDTGITKLRQSFPARVFSEGCGSSYRSAITLKKLHNYSTDSILYLTNEEVEWLLKYETRVELFAEVVEGSTCQTINPTTAAWLIPEEATLAQESEYDSDLEV